MARPSKYKPEFAAEARRLCLLGLVDADLAEWFDVSESTLNLWKTKHPEFSEAVKAGREPADGRVAASLFKRAIGYAYSEVKTTTHADGTVETTRTTKHHAPNVGACAIWLKNRQPERWRDRPSPEVGYTHEQALAELEQLCGEDGLTAAKRKLLAGIDLDQAAEGEPSLADG